MSVSPCAFSVYALLARSGPVHCKRTGLHRPRRPGPLAAVTTPRTLLSATNCQNRTRAALRRIACRDSVTSVRVPDGSGPLGPWGTYRFLWTWALSVSPGRHGPLTAARQDVEWVLGCPDGRAWPMEWWRPVLTAAYPSGLRERIANPRFMGSNPTAAFVFSPASERSERPEIATLSRSRAGFPLSAARAGARNVVRLGWYARPIYMAQGGPLAALTASAA